MILIALLISILETTDVLEMEILYSYVCLQNHSFFSRKINPLVSERSILSVFGVRNICANAEQQTGKMNKTI